ncbi:hypothetical protein ACFYM2_08435 [Streptomyces sp. NPDC006711]|uniref:hypothetical protein n=1 Tax=unclassified Streptomyces TaxID=2593676 RepID=UPI0036BEB795
MHGQHARPASPLFGPAPAAGTTPAGHGGPKHSRPHRRTGRLRRRILAYQAIDFQSTHLPETAGPGEECLLFVHFRQVVGQIRYRFCESCAHGVITDVVIDERFHDTGLGTRALSHLSSRHPGAVWSSDSRTWSTGGTRDLPHRMRVPATAAATPCAHIHAPLSRPAHTTA